MTFPLATFADQYQELETQAEYLSPLEEEILWLQEETYVTTATKTFEDIKKSGARCQLLPQKT